MSSYRVTFIGGRLINRRLLSVILASAALIMMMVPAHAQSWSNEQLEVWNIVQAQWEATKDKDSEWTKRFLHDDFVGWANDIPAPRTRSSVANWDRLDMEDSTTLLQELTPLGIVIHGNTAVAHYVYSQTTEDGEGERKTTHGRYTDTLVKDGDNWLFLAWHGGDDLDD